MAGAAPRTTAVHLKQPLRATMSLDLDSARLSQRRDCSRGAELALAMMLAMATSAKGEML